MGDHQEQPPSIEDEEGKKEEEEQEQQNQQKQEQSSASPSSSLPSKLPAVGDSCCQIVFIQGPSGSGKSVLVKELIKQQEEEKRQRRLYPSNDADSRTACLHPTTTGTGATPPPTTTAAAGGGGTTTAYYYCGGKFNQMKSTEPFAALKQAFSELCDNLLNYLPYKDRRDISKDLYESIGTCDSKECNLLSNVIPSIKDLLYMESNESENVDDEEGATDAPTLSTSKSPPPSFPVDTTLSNDVAGNNNEESFGRLKYLVTSFLKVTCNHVPVIMFIDDLQWSDLSTLQLLQGILDNSEIRNFMFLGAFRDDNESEEIYDDLVNMINEITAERRKKKLQKQPQQQEQQKNKIDDSQSLGIHRISVQPLDVQAINQIICYLTKLDTQEVEALASLVHHRTHGNAFVVLQYLHLLETERLLEYSLSDYKWKYDIANIEEQTFLADSVVEMVATRIRTSLPKSSQSVLSVVACLWSKFHISSLYLVLSGLQGDGHATMHDDDSASNGINEIKSLDDLVERLRVAAKQGLIDILKNGYYKFAHDRIQQSAYSIVPEGRERELLHLRIGKVILKIRGDHRTDGIEQSDPDHTMENRISKATPPTIAASTTTTGFITKTAMQNKTWVIFTAADQLNRGSKYLTEASERIDLSKLNLEAATRAISVSAFVPAWKYLKSGIDVLGENKWNGDVYDLTRDLIVNATDMATCLGKYDEGRTLAEEGLNNVRSIDEKLPIYYSQVKALGQQARLEESAARAVQILRTLGVPFPRNPNMVQVIVELLKTKLIMKGVTDADIKLLPTMTDAKVSASVRVMQLYWQHCILRQKPAGMLYCILKMLQLTIKHGLHKISPSAVCAYGLVIASVFGDINEAYRLGSLALRLVEQLDAREIESNVMVIFCLYMRHWRETYTECIEHLLRGYRSGMTHGDVEYAFYNAICQCTMYYSAGLPLGPCEKDCRFYCKQMLDYKRDSNYSVSCPTWQLLLNLIGHHSVRDPFKFTGEAMDEDAFVEENTKRKNVGALQTFWINKCQLAYYLEDWNEADALLVKFGKTKSTLATHVFAVIYTFFSGLNNLALARSTKKKRKYKRAARPFIKLMKSWVQAGNMNLSHKLMLLNAEYEALNEHRGERLRKLYDNAIATAARGGFIQDAALANERAGICFSDLQDDYWAGNYIDRAYTLYSEWGAQTKVRRLQESHPIILNERQSNFLTVDTGNVSRSSDGSSNVKNAKRKPPVTDGRRSSTSFRGVTRLDPTFVQRHESVDNISHAFSAGPIKGASVDASDTEACKASITSF